MFGDPVAGDVGLAIETGLPLPPSPLCREMCLASLESVRECLTAFCLDGYVTAGSLVEILEECVGFTEMRNELSSALSSILRTPFVLDECVTAVWQFKTFTHCVYG